MLLAWVPSQTQPNLLTLDDLTVRGDRLSYDQRTGRVFAEGHVLIETDDAWLTADYAEFDESRQVAEARGRVTLSAPDRYLTGDHLIYDMEAQRGEMSSPDGWDESVGIRLFVSGSKLAFEEGRWTLDDAYIRSSGKEDPSYELWAGRIEYAEGHSWYGTDVRVEFFGIEIVETGDFEQRVEDFGLTGLAWLPAPGTSEQDGVFADWIIQRDVTGDLRMLANARLGTRSGLSGKVVLTEPLGDDLSVWGAGAWRELVGGQLRPFLRWDRLETGMTWRLTSPEDDWWAQADASYGFFRERPTLRRSTRTTAGVITRSQIYEWGEDTQVFAEAGVRGFQYGTGRRYGFVRLGGFFHHRFDRDWRLWGGLVKHYIGGQPELVTDEVVIPYELRLGARARITDRIAAEGEIRYDLDRGDVRYTVLGLRYRSADFVYRLRYNVETRFLILELLLPDS
jgi:hypothetical protein